jgi:alpha-soluble NSF attachment protein
MSALSKSQKNKALELIGQAEATLQKKVFSFFGGGAAAKERQAEDAAEIYLQAANAYKVGGLSHEAGETYLVAGSLYRDKCNNPGDAAKAYTQAGK